MNPPGPEAGTVVYDGTCGFCRFVVHRLAAAHGLRGRLTPWQSADLAGMGLSEAQARTRMWFVVGQHRAGGAAAFAAWLRTGDRRARLAGKVLALPVVRGVAEAVYRGVAKHRHRIPGPWERRCEV